MADFSESRTNSTSVKFDVFADLTNEAKDSLEALARNSALLAQAQTITCVVDATAPDFVSAQDSRIRIIATKTPVIEFADALERARSRRCHLLILIGGNVDTVAIASLASVIDEDPMIGFASPRFADADESGILPLPSAEAKQPLRGYSRDILRYVDRLQIIPELVSACVLIRRQLVDNAPGIDGIFSTTAGALNYLMIWGRHRGYCTVVANHVVISGPASGVAYPVAKLEERMALLKQYPYLFTVDKEYNDLPCHRREAWLNHASAILQEPRRLLLDCRGMLAGFNGTTEGILGYLVGLSLLNTNWSVTVLAPNDAARFHGLHERFPQFHIIADFPNDLHTVAIRLSQPWNLNDLFELHSQALLVAVNILDTIVWDLIFGAPGLGELWSLVAKCFDGILYNSHFSRDRFNFRFPVAPDVREAVTHLSFRYEDYMGESIRTSNDGGHILLVGNVYDHKGIDQAIDFLANAFPHERFVIVSSSDKVQANARYISSGQIPQADIDKLYADAKMLVFPSFYEGFGFPVVKGLSCGLDVVARRSALLYEVGRHCMPNGRIIPFDDPQSLVIAVGQILAGEAVETVPLGGAIDLGAKPLNWRDVASRVIDFAEGLTAEISTHKYDMRESALRLALLTKSS